MPYVSLDMRRGMQAEATDDVAVLLVTVTHPDLDAPIRFSSDPTERLSTEPLVYGTHSDGEEYLYALRGVTLPDDDYTGAGSGQLVVDDIDGTFTRALRSISSYVVVRCVIVRAAAPDDIEFIYDDLRIAGMEASAGILTLDLAYIDGDEPCPCDVMGKNNFPGLFR